MSEVGQSGAISNLDIVCVKEGASGDGASWDNAFGDLQEAIDKAYEIANKYNNIVRVHIAKGTYKPNSHPNGGKGSREKHFSLRNGVEVIGGYSSNGGENDPKTYKTVLSGDIGTKDDNVYHIFYHPEGTSLDNTAKLTGVIITKGNANGSDDNRRGGGMFNDKSSPTLTNCTFTKNEATFGGGIDNYKNSSPRLTGCEFTDNEADSGGGMFNWYNSSPMLADCEFTDNEATDFGGGMINNDSSPTLTDCTFTKNKAAMYGGGMINDNNSSPTLTDCTFTKNKATRYGGGMINGNSSPTLTDCEFTDNEATTETGGGIINGNSSPTLTDCTFTKNKAAMYGGGMINLMSSPTLTNCKFSKNEVTEKGGAVYSDKDSNPKFDDDTKKSFIKTDSTNPDGKNNGNFKEVS